MFKGDGKDSGRTGSVQGGNKEIAVSKFVASTLTHFCEQNERFAEVVYKTQRTLSECCAEIMDGVGNTVSDIDVYRGAVQSYFPNADVAFVMNIEIKGDAPDDSELTRPGKKKVTETKTRNTPVNADKDNNTVPAVVKREEPEQIQLTLF